MKMISWFSTLLLIASITTFPLASQEARFTPPKGWRMAEPDKLPPHVQIMVVGEGKLEFPPSINLSTEEYAGTLDDYLKIVKKINDDNEAVWKDLGKIKTEAGEASLSQAENITQYGSVRMMHVILVKDGMVYILTAGALKSEFSMHYKDFFEAFRSFSIKQ